MRWLERGGGCESIRRRWTVHSPKQRALVLRHHDPAGVRDRIAQVTAGRGEVGRARPRLVVEDLGLAVRELHRDRRDEVLELGREAVRRAALQVRAAEDRAHTRREDAGGLQVDRRLAEGARAQRATRYRFRYGPGVDRDRKSTRLNSS